MSEPLQWPFVRTDGSPYTWPFVDEDTRLFQAVDSFHPWLHALWPGVVGSAALSREASAFATSMAETPARAYPAAELLDWAYRMAGSLPWVAGSQPANVDELAARMPEIHARLRGAALLRLLSVLREHGLLDAVAARFPAQLFDWEFLGRLAARCDRCDGLVQTEPLHAESGMDARLRDAFVAIPHEAYEPSLETATRGYLDEFHALGGRIVV